MFLTVALVVFGCGQTPFRPLFDLRETMFTKACRGIALERRLTGSANDPRIAWEPGGRRLVWPVGFVARFTPTLEILDRDGHLVMEEGDAVTGACVAGPADDPDSLLLIDGLLVPRGSV